MKRDLYYRGQPGAKWGIWNAQRKCWQFDICEDTPMLAEARLFSIIGDDARKYRFEPRRLPAVHGQWVEFWDEARGKRYGCSVCAASVAAPDDCCPSCGAKMDGAGR